MPALAVTPFRGQPRRSDLSLVPRPKPPSMKPGSTRYRIVKLLAEDPRRHWRIHDIAEALGVRRSAVAVALSVLCEWRQVTRVEHGVYRAPWASDAVRRGPNGELVPMQDDEFMRRLEGLQPITIQPEAEDDDAEGEFDLSAPPPVRPRPAAPPPLPDVRGIDRWQQQIAWCAAAVGGNQAAARLLLDSIDALIWREVGRLASRSRGRIHEADFDDLHAEAQLVVIERAVPKFEPERGLRFTTYAMWWIRAAISRWRAVHARTIRIPVGLGEAAAPIARARGRLREELGREPTVDEVAARSGRTRSQVLRLRQAGVVTSSLDEHIGTGGEENLTLYDRLADDAPNAEERLLQDDPWRHVEVRDAIATLPIRERAVLEARMRDCTLKEIGRAAGLSRERIRQLEVSALRKLRQALEGLRREDSAA